MPKRKLFLPLSALLALGIAFLFLPEPAGAEFVTIKHNSDGGDACTDNVCIDTVSLTGGLVTGWIPIHGYRAVTFGIKLVDANNSVTALTMDCETSNLKTTTAGSGYDVCVSVSTAATGTSTIVCPHLWSTINASADHYNLTVDNLNADYLQCAFAGTGVVTATVDTAHVRMLKKTP